MRKLLSRSDIEQRVAELAYQIDADYSGSSLVVVGILNGAFMFTSDLVKHLETPLEVGFLKASSYEGTQSKGVVQILLPPTVNVEGKNVLIVEDVVDTGLTCDCLGNYFKQAGASSVSVCSLVMKKDMPSVKYKGFWLPGHFVVGYGMDYNGQFRNLPELYIMEE